MSDLAVGQELITGNITLTRFSLVRYAGASGDFNPIHYRDDVAASVGLPGVLAHGMLTMGLAVQPVIDWMGDRGELVEYGVRFTRPVVVDGNGGVVVTVSAKVGAIEDDVTRIDLTVSAANQTVLGKSQVRVKLNK
ncbi:acyl dehydratase [Salinibacterium sp. NSLL150]|uniref:MaoC/PaaZ C-terminal domain-containing protein n=1 Tax=unclassified Salinibacterium TaxID=2632331 RepID=UPI0018CEBAAC|nr:MULTISPECIES: MaoC/PaaZ C-terminal domain-containing protein [unclassified Salinibacterium]MBH0099853.1 acyl dehydratase [Salinibacterium sp. NSLL35]MBH0102607.1 acyl dehydratase [Salinibacterium sp. NSLL150]MBH0105367.1 acyl dehydratase [Salinibacterium sp. NSLL16]MBH0108127.1 acyl dehydratase [Salinibacterium sp. NSLL17]